MSAAQSRLGERLSLESLFKRVGPGVITGAADDDPSGIAT
jgi:Mn2+/Fe2+ NRAMP family transporter